MSGTLPILVLPILIAAFVGTHVVMHEQDQAPAARTIVAPDRTDAATLKQAGFDLSKRHSRLYNGRQVIVMGALAGDTTSAQFWLDKEHFTVVRIISQRGEPRLER